MEITFTLEEAELLMDVLEERHRELLREISRTTHREFKVRLRKGVVLASVPTTRNCLRPSSKSCMWPSQNS
jgi:hypothetical protein